MKIKVLGRISWMPAIFVIVSLACAGTSGTPAATAAAQSSAADSSQPGLTPIDLPTERANQASDQDSSPFATKKLVQAGDKFVKDLFERPFNANTMDIYFPYLDIVDTQGYKDSDWGFETITMAGTDSNGKLPAKYAAEIDLNRDGRGEWLILVSNPTSTEWTHQGVQVWNDANGDVGATQPTIADSHATGDGYEKLVFDGSTSTDSTDVARVRISADDPKTVEIAFSMSMLGNPSSFAMGAWAGTDMLNPALFDLNDHMTHEEAGSPLKDLYVYPLKKLAEIDNSCRMAIGFQPNGTEPGLCFTIQKDTSGAAPVAGCTPNPAATFNNCKVP